MEELIFKYIEVRPDSAHAIKHLRRGRDGALILIKNNTNHWVLGGKSHYPEGVSKLIGGGIDDTEDPLTAARRELEEEVGVSIDEVRLVPLVHAEVWGKDGGNDVNFSAFVFYAQINQAMQAQDDVDALVYLSDAEMNQLIDRLFHLSEEHTIEADHSATWADYGKVWGPIHKAAFERVKELSL